MSTHLWWYIDGAIWAVNLAAWKWEQISKAGERAGMAIGRHMLAVQRQNDQLAELQVEVMLLQLSRHTGGTYYPCRKMSEGGYDW